MHRQKANPCRLACPQRSPSLVPATSHVTAWRSLGPWPIRANLWYLSLSLASFLASPPCGLSFRAAPAEPALHADESSFNLHPHVLELMAKIQREEGRSVDQVFSLQEVHCLLVAIVYSRQE
jgi:hypothetical protein